jgi:glycosyltransferase involved in cell wall biosynthesis
MLLDRRFPPDRRAEREAAALKRAGHTIFLLAAGNPALDVRLELETDAVRVRYIPPLSRVARYRQSYDFQRTLRHRHWGRHIGRFVRDFSLDALHVHELPLLGTALDAVRELHLPVAADLRAHYPALVDLRRARANPLVAALMAPSRRWLEFEAQTLVETAHIFVSAPEARTRLIDSHHLWPDAVTVLMDAEEVGRFGTPHLDLSAGGDPALRLLCIGGHGDQGGIETAVRALAKVTAEIPDAQLAVVGTDRPEASALKAMARRARVSHRLLLRSTLPPDELRGGVVAVLPYASNPHTETNLPHELFVFMLLGLPVVASDCVPMKAVVEETGSGVLFAAGDADDLARQIVALAHDPGARRQLGSAGRLAAETKYNWETEARKLAAAYERINRERQLIPADRHRPEPQ